MPQSFAHFGFAKLEKLLGSDIISLSFFGTEIVVTSSMQTATELFETRSAIYSDRSCPPALGEPSLMNWGNFVGVIGYNDTWRKYRQMMHVWLNKKAAPAFHQSQQHQARLLLQRLLTGSDNLSASEELDLELYSTIASNLLESIYGYQPRDTDDVFVIGMKDVALKFGIAAAPNIKVPEWLPGAGWKSKLREWGKQKDDISDGLLSWTKSQMAAGNDNNSMVASFLKDSNKWGHTAEEVDAIIREVGVGLFGGGFLLLSLRRAAKDLRGRNYAQEELKRQTVDTIVVFLLAMLLFPEVQAKAQKEIDMVVGTTRLPTMDDQPNLPYLGRLIQEVLRWQPVAPLGIPHVCAKDDEYKGYRVPKGAIVAMSRDEQVYKDPETFNPDRYLDPNVPYIPAFGWGRRMCPGIHYAKSSLYISIASLLAVFDISMHKDAAGQYITPTTEGAENTVAYHPKPFKIKFTARSLSHIELVRKGA
ncbi:cytochrome P450 family protein [Ceratobasidium sp. AG-Ba]|nr:cytochrome P450 family protein [Ceratobasidium sp. AG-Ba]